MDRNIMVIIVTAIICVSVVVCVVLLFLIDYLEYQKDLNISYQLSNIQRDVNKLLSKQKKAKQ